MKLTCPKCQQVIAPEQINVAEGAALCPGCGEVYQLGELLEPEQLASEGDLGDPPRGAWFKASLEEWEVGTTTRSAVAWFLVPFMCVWSGFSLGGLYGSQIIAGQFDLGKSVFGIPFLLGTILFGSIAVMSVCGKVYLRVVGDAALLFMGVGAAGWRKRFAWNSVIRVREKESQGENGSSYSIVLERQQGAPIQFIGFVNDERRRFILQVLRRMLRARSTGTANDEAQTSDRL